MSILSLHKGLKVIIFFNSLNFDITKNIAINTVILLYVYVKMIQII